MDRFDNLNKYFILPQDSALQIKTKYLQVHYKVDTTFHFSFEVILITNEKVVSTNS